MSTPTESAAVNQKTRELCQTILDQPEVKAMRRNIEVFMADEQARGQYEQLMDAGQKLQEQQESGTPLNQKEVDAFEALREGFLKNSVARGFLDAQDDMRRLQKTVTAYVSKSFELGRVPEESELDSGSCGHGCGCHH